MNRPLNVSELVGEHVRLEPLSEAHVDELVDAAVEERGTFGFMGVPRDHDAMLADVRRLLGDHASGDAVPFAQVSVASGRVVGMTRYLNIRRRAGEEVPYAVEIGGTWLCALAQRTGMNTEHGETGRKPPKRFGAAIRLPR